MTPGMVRRAREQAAASGYTNVEFRLGEIEHLPVANDSVDVVISNCVLNLVPDKRAVFAELEQAGWPINYLLASSGVEPEEKRF